MTTEAEAVAKLAQEQERKPFFMKDGGRTWLVHPNDGEGNPWYYTEVTDENGLKLNPPSHVQAKVRLFDTASFVEYVNIYKKAQSIIVCDPIASTFVARLDWHEPDAADFDDHRVQLKLSFSEEWTRWNGIDRALKPQDEFARFLEENHAEIVKPDASSLIELARDFSIRRESQWRRASRAQNGDVSFAWDEETKPNSNAATKGEVVVPNDFTLSIPIYLNERPVELMAFLRYRFNDQKLTLGLELHRKEYVRQAMVREIAATIREQTKLPVLVGENSTTAI